MTVNPTSSINSHYNLNQLPETVGALFYIHQCYISCYTPQSSHFMALAAADGAVGSALSGSWSTWVPCVNVSQSYVASRASLLFSCLPNPTLSTIVNGQSLFFSTRTTIMPTPVPFPSLVQPNSQGAAMIKEARGPVSDGLNTAGTSAPSRLKRHKHYYMSEGNIVIQVCSATLTFINSWTQRF